ncbi:MAG: T9SS type A sorting domain-containing protein, partial [Bacteroidota bacterium]
VVRTDPFGDTLWTRTFGTSEWDFVNDLKLLSDGNYLLAGSSESSSFGNTAGWLQTITPNGLPVFSRLITDADHRYEFTGVDQANDSILYVCGSMTAITGNIHRPILLQLKYPSLDSSWMFVGDTSWGDAEFSGVSVTRGLQPVACGHSILNGRSDKDILLCKTDTAGNPVWTRIITSTFNEYLTRVITQGDSIVCSGTTDQYGGGGQDFYVIRFRPNGTFLRGRTFGDSESDVAYDVVNSRGNRITAFGTTRSYGTGIVSMMIVACDDSMNLTPPMVVGTEDSKDEASELQLFPNPSEGLIHLTADGMTIHGLIATLTDFSGREIWKMMMTDAEIDLRNEPNGIYLLKLYKEETVRTFRLVIAK